ncbi:MAG: hypothetical protein ACFE0P_00795 [Oceanicaulis sp.]
MLTLSAALTLSCSSPVEVDDPIARVDAFVRGETRLEELGVFALARDNSPAAQGAWARLETGLAFMTMQAGPGAGPGCKWSRAETQMVLARAVDGNCQISLEPEAIVAMEEARLFIRAAYQSLYIPTVEGFYAAYFAPPAAYRLGLERMQTASADDVTTAWYINEVGADWCGSRDLAFGSIESWVVEGGALAASPPPEFVHRAMEFPEATAEFRIRAQALLEEREAE